MSRRSMCLPIAIVLFAGGLALHVSAGWAEETLKNRDVLKMIAAGLSDEIIVGKIQEVPNVDFQLAVDDLVALRSAGASERVVHAMLDRARKALPRGNPSQGQASPGIALQTGAGVAPLHIVIGEVSAAGFGWVSNTFMNYAGLRSTVRTHDKRPVLLVTCNMAPEVGHYFVAKLDADKRHSVRSLKIGKAVRRSGQPGGRLAPDDDWVIPFDIKEDSPGTWNLIVQRDLEPGEYGLYINLETTPMGESAIEGYNTSTPMQKCFQGGGIFDFGVD